MKRRLSVLGGLVIVIAVGGYFFLRFMDAPSSASRISMGSSMTTTATQSVSLGKPVAVAGSYASFSYPSNFTAETLQVPGGDIVAQYGYDYHATIPWQLSITITSLPGGEVNDDAAYYAMMQNSSRYSKTSETVGPNEASVFTDTTAGGFDKVAVLFHGSYSADISLTSEDEQYVNEEQTTLDQVLQSWRWN
jgi:hypothetical protein